MLHCCMAVDENFTFLPFRYRESFSGDYIVTTAISQDDMPSTSVNFGGAFDNNLGYSLWYLKDCIPT